MQTLFLFMPGTTPGIFLYIIFGTTASSKQKLAAALARVLPRRRRELLPNVPNGRGGCFSCLRRKTADLPTTNAPVAGGGKITIERSLTMTSSTRLRSSGKYGDEELPDPTDIWMNDIPRRSESAMSYNRMKPLPLAPNPSFSKFRGTGTGTAAYGPAISPTDFTTVSPKPAGGRLTAIDEKSNVGGGSASRPTTGDSSRVQDDYHRLDPEHSDDSGPILPIQRQEVRFSADVFNPARPAASRDRQSKNFSLPRR